ncbi:MAG: Ig-like domain-containing protein [Bacteroidales bacterium]
MKKVLVPTVIVLTILIISQLFYSCANTSQAPTGGPKDTLAPIVVEMIPENNQINHPINKGDSKIRIKFNEYVVLQNSTQEIYLSPPIDSRLKTKINGKSIVVNFEDSLKSNTTYTLNFGASIKDNNEGNKLPPFSYTFSTGIDIDSIYTTGIVMDYQTLVPLSGIKVMFYSDLSDSAVIKKNPDYISKTDEWGFFVMRNIKSLPMKVYAIEDKDNNNRYDIGMDKIAFMDSIFIPTKIMSPDTLELSSISLKDTNTCLSRKSDIRLSLFKEISSRQYLKNSGRSAIRMMYLTFGTRYAKVNSITLKEIDSTSLIKQWNNTEDSLAIWINDQHKIPDTLHMYVKYLKTDDSLNVLKPVSDSLIMIRPKPKYKKDDYGDYKEVIDTVAKMKMTAIPANIDQDGIILDFDYPLIKKEFDKIIINAITPKQQTIPQKFTIIQDSLINRIYYIRLKEKITAGNDYIINLPHRIFQNINGFYCDSLVKKINLPQNDDLSSITIKLRNVIGNYIIEMTDKSRTKILKHFYVHNDKDLLFPYLKEGKYAFRITQDRNNNNMLDTGNLLEHKQPEKVLLFKFGTGNSENAYLLKLPKRIDLEQEIDLKEMFSK